METKTKISFEQIKSLLEKSYALSYVDYRESFDESLEEVQKAISCGDYSPLVDMIQPNEGEWESIKNILSALEGEVERKFGISEEEAEELVEEHEEELRYEIESRDDSDVIGELLKHTGEQVFFYSTGTEIEDYTTPIAYRLKEVKKALKIAQKDKSFDAELTDMLNNAGYGGSLVIYFEDYIKDYIYIDEKINQIQFSGNVVVAVIDNCNGSGGDCTIKREIKLPFDRKNLFLDAAVHYSYTYEVCGMSSDWCKTTNVQFGITKSKKKAQISKTNDYLAQEAKYDEVFKSGKCSMGDVNIKRHRGTFYINDFPCGTKCPHCGTFWID